MSAPPTTSEPRAPLEASPEEDDIIDQRFLYWSPRTKKRFPPTSQGYLMSILFCEQCDYGYAPNPDEDMDVDEMMLEEYELKYGCAYEWGMDTKTVDLNPTNDEEVEESADESPEEEEEEEEESSDEDWSIYTAPVSVVDRIIAPRSSAPYKPTFRRFPFAFYSFEGIPDKKAYLESIFDRSDLHSDACLSHINFPINTSSPYFREYVFFVNLFDKRPNYAQEVADKNHTTVAQIRPIYYNYAADMLFVCLFAPTRFRFEMDFSITWARHMSILSTFHDKRCNFAGIYESLCDSSN